jgi:hypothetical protein
MDKMERFMVLRDIEKASMHIDAVIDDDSTLDFLTQGDLETLQRALIVLKRSRDRL